MKKKTGVSRPRENQKVENLQQHTTDNDGQFLSTNQGLRINDNQNSLKTDDRGATLLEDFILREKITHFDHERIPDRIVHARGSGAHGVFKLHTSMEKYTKAGFLTDTRRETPVFARFSTVAGGAGSTDMARDVRGFAVKFYTEEGNYDLVGNNIPVFFIQDAMKFPDLVHAVRPEPDNGIPQAASAHDTFWDFISLMPESMHMIMWAMSDRAIPRSLRMMEGFGVHTFKLVNSRGKMSFVKFHWKPVLGVHSVAWDEAVKLSGKDSDFHRRDLWNAIESGNFPEWDLGLQIIPEEDEFKFEFDLLDPTKLVPEELVPVQIVGRMTLNRNPDNFFAETEQVAFHPGHVVPGIDFSNDPLLQGRLFSYTDTQLSRLGSPNFHEIPINRPINGIHNNQRDGHMRQQIVKGKVSYQPNTLAGGCPYQAMMREGGFVSHNERIDGQKIRTRSLSFIDHYSQAKLFLHSQSAPERKHLTNALIFELSKLQTPAVRERVIGMLSFVDMDLAREVGNKFGVKPVRPKQQNFGVPADGNVKDYQSEELEMTLREAPSLSMVNTVKNTIRSREIAFLIHDGVDGAAVTSLRSYLEGQGAKVHLVSENMAPVKGSDGSRFTPDHSTTSTASVCYDAVYVAAGKRSAARLKGDPAAVLFINEAYKHCKAVAFGTDTDVLLQATHINTALKDPALIMESKGRFEKSFSRAIANHRVWDLEEQRNNPS